MKWQQAGFNIFLNMFGASQIPFAISQMGWVWGPIIFVLLVACSWWSGHVLVDCCIHSKTYTWKDLGTRAFGACGGHAVGWLQTIGIVLTGVLQTQGGSSVWAQSFPDVGICAWWWMVVNAAPLIIFLQIPSFGGSWVMVFATTVAIISTIWQQVLYLTLMGVNGKYPYLCYGGQTLGTAVAATCNMMFSFGVKNILPEMTREMVNPKEMHKSWFWSQAVAMPLYALYGFLGFYMYGIFNQNASFGLQFDRNNWQIAYNIFSLFGNLVPTVYGQICIFLKVELALGVSPRDWWTVTNPGLNRIPRIPPILFRFLFRSTIILLYLVAAEALLHVGLGFFSSLVGSTAMTAFSFYLPWVVLWRLRGTEISPLMKVVCLFWILCGLFAAGAGLYFSAKEMAHMSGGLFVFEPEDCAQNAFYIGRYSGGGYHNPDNRGAFSTTKGNGSFYQDYYLPTCHNKDGKVHIECGQINGPTPPADFCPR